MDEQYQEQYIYTLDGHALQSLLLKMNQQNMKLKKWFITSLISIFILFLVVSSVFTSIIIRQHKQQSQLRDQVNQDQDRIRQLVDISAQLAEVDIQQAKVNHSLLNQVKMIGSIVNEMNGLGPSVEPETVNLENKEAK